MRKWAILNRKSKGIYMYLCGLLSDIFCALLHFPGKKQKPKEQRRPVYICGWRGILGSTSRGTV